ncbi:MAG TPA: Gfo/Idh/MocA family oxidoreductase [Candidatus Limnocylindria bacterium]|nr:Gfo/Idh/MocA family oxidoreductase [Candidatus Limnocylindria bacterium]
MKKEQTSLAGESRRDFIKKTSIASAALAATGILKTPVYGADTAPSTGRVIGANDRIAVAVIGVGYGIGQDHIMGMQNKGSDNNVVVAAGCDLFSKRRDWMMGRADQYGRKMPQPLKESDVYTEYQKVLDRKDIDAVVVATHDVWHSTIAIQAMQSGKHVYCEKPMTRYLGEAFQVYDAVKSTGKILQVGSQGCSAGGWHKAAELIKGGEIGQLIWSQGYYCRNNPKGEWNYDIDPETKPGNLDWEKWLGQVKKRPSFSADHFHRWRKYYPYCGGLLGDLVPHRLHPLMLASGNPEFPRRVVSIGSKNVHSDKKTPGTPERDVPEHVQLTAEFPSGYLLTVTCSTVNAKSPGFVIYGHKATMNLGNNGERLEILPERWASEEVEPKQISGMQAEDIRFHEKNWFDCIRANKQPNAGIDLAIRVQTVISLAEQSERQNMACLFDEKTRKVTDGNGKEVPALTYGSLELS